MTKKEDKFVVVGKASVNVLMDGTKKYYILLKKDLKAGEVLSFQSDSSVVRIWPKIKTNNA